MYILNRIHDFGIKYIYMIIALNEACDSFICTILFVLSESTYMILFKDLEFKVKETSNFCDYSFKYLFV